MRNALAEDLVANLLGPRNGRKEKMRENPVFEYVTGILAPVGGDAMGDETGTRNSELKGANGRFDDNDDPTADTNPMLSPALDPNKLPSSMGMSFCVRFNGETSLDVCATWGNYTKIEDGWRRVPGWATLSVCGDTVATFGKDGKRTKGKEAAIEIRVEAKREEDVTVLSIYMINRMHQDSKNKANPERHVFQPQIRISCPAGVEIVPKPSLSTDDEEAEFEILYAGQKMLGRGHMTSVVWKEIDPEILHGVARQGDLRPGFGWVDRGSLPEDEREKFAKADIRTEFIPMHPALSPDVDSWPDGLEKPRLDAEFYSEQYDPAKLREALEPFDTACGTWVDKLQSMRVDNGGVKHRVIQEAGVIHKRIRDGINYLCEDDDARLAFCFASRALYQQSVWAKHEPKPFKFRPFQLGFILLSARSALDPESPDRDVCDLLWVPTGTGKTEAYLFLVAMTTAHRRLKAQQRDSGDRTGAGVSVISRYTLRLLTIQQFRRTLSLFVAMEYLRVVGLSQGASVGWRPAGFQDRGSFLWGTTRFSVGLWVGRDVTPNKFKDYGYKGSTPGAKTILQNPHGHKAEPAQILDCPACGAILSLPPVGLMPGLHTMHHIVKVTSGADRATAAFDKNIGGVKDARSVSVSSKHNHDQIFTLSTVVDVKDHLYHRDLEGICDAVKNHAKQHGVDFEYLSARSRPGYFFKRYNSTEYDFEIFCPNKTCPLNVPWAAGSPLGNTNGALDDVLTDTARGVQSADGNNFVNINEAFEIEPCVSDRIPIPAFTTDEQVYGQMPTMVVATVDKFARMPFEWRTAQLFGNADHYHRVRGYYRGEDHPTPKRARNTSIRKLEQPNLVIQDELHLLDGPLGSMVGIYETAINHMASRSGHPAKYIASTATIRQADSHVKALFAKKLAVFPPQGLSASDRLFITGRWENPLDESLRGRLYIGVCAPSKGTITPLVRIWSRLRCSIDNHRDDPHAHEYWTITGYFNALRELAGATSLYKQDIPDRVEYLSGGQRLFSEERALELSSRTPSTDLPAYLNRLKDSNKDTAPEALFTTSMFGTGVDISQLSTMIVNGQPKTSSSYIQATGRVGRRRGAIVVTFYRATRPRDLDHYEQFSKYHMQLHRFVEPPVVFPFAEGVMKHALGPVIVSLLRNKRGCDDWAQDESAVKMKDGFHGDEVKMIEKIVLDHVSKQPKSRRPERERVAAVVKSCIAQWREAATREQGLRYAEYGEPKNPVVLGDPAHAQKNKSPVYDDVPTSMRQVEEEAKFDS